MLVDLLDPLTCSFTLERVGLPASFTLDIELIFADQKCLDTWVEQNIFHIVLFDWEHVCANLQLSIHEKSWLICQDHKVSLLVAAKAEK